jgi:hypothetical protein
VKPLFPDWSGELDVAARQLAGAVVGSPSDADVAHAAAHAELVDTTVPVQIAAALADVVGLAVLLVLLAGVLALGVARGTAAVLQGDQARRPENAR